MALTRSFRLLLLIAPLAAFPAAAQADDVLSPLEARVLNAPNPVLGSDNRIHLAYELKIANQSPAFVDVQSVRTLAGRRVVDRMADARLGRLLRLDGNREGTSIAPGGGAMLFMDVSFRRGARLPARLRHRFQLTLRTPSGDQTDENDLHQETSPPQRLAFTGLPVKVRRTRAVRLQPPLRGDGWVVGNGCCDPITAHRAATLSINGSIHVAERFGIDFVRMDANRVLFTGENIVTNYNFFGVDVLAAAAGRVVATRNDRPEQVLGKLPEGATVHTADGNYAVIDIGGGRYTLYAHMSPGSVRVRPGQRVSAGQVLGKLGNTGNSDAPHLHFHVMDGRSAVASNGLPSSSARSPARAWSPTRLPRTRARRRPSRAGDWPAGTATGCRSTIRSSTSEVEIDASTRRRRAGPAADGRRTGRGPELAPRARGLRRLGGDRRRALAVSGMPRARLAHRDPRGGPAQPLGLLERAHRGDARHHRAAWDRALHARVRVRQAGDHAGHGRLQPQHARAHAADRSRHGGRPARADSRRRHPRAGRHRGALDRRPDRAAVRGHPSAPGGGPRHGRRAVRVHRERLHPGADGRLRRAQQRPPSRTRVLHRPRAGAVQAELRADAPLGPSPPAPTR